MAHHVAGEGSRLQNISTPPNPNISMEFSFVDFTSALNHSKSGKAPDSDRIEIYSP